MLQTAASLLQQSLHIHTPLRQTHTYDWAIDAERNRNRIACDCELSQREREREHSHFALRTQRS